MKVGVELEKQLVQIRIGHTDNGKFVIDIPQTAVGVQAMMPDDARILAAAILKSALLAEGKDVPRHLMVSLP
jgi:hypothetical protein